MTDEPSLRRGAHTALWLAAFLALSPTLYGATPPNAAPHAAVPTDAIVSEGARRHTIAGKPRIGRIFFSPTERRHRSDKALPDAPSSDRALGGERLEINGAVSSSTRGRAVWVNGALIENSAKFKSAWTDGESTVWLRDDRRAPRIIRAGQILDPASGAIEDLLPAGSVARH